MAELYVKPGNRQKGWNDPPQFSYGLQQQQQLQAPRAKKGAPPRPPRAPEAAEGAQKRTTTTTSSSSPSTAAGPPRPPPSPAGLPVFPPRPAGLPSTPGLPAPSLVSEAEEDCDVEDVLSPLNEALDNCRKTVRKQVCDDIGKRLSILQQMWEQGKLSAPVRKGMRILTQEFKSQRWDAADEIHRSLMVDHVTEVSQWMVGVKRLIAETRNLPTEDQATADYEQKVETSLEPECQQDEAEPRVLAVSN